MIKCFRLSSQTLIPINSPASTLDLFTASVSDGFYSTFSTLNGGTRVLGLTLHLQRLYKPALENKLTPSTNEIFLRKQIAELAKQNLPKESRIRIILTKDTGDVYIAIQSFESLPDSVYQNGVHVITSSISRTDPRIKDTSFISKSNEQRKLLNKDVFEILLTKNGKVLEGMTSNFYVIANVPPNLFRFSNTRDKSRGTVLITAQRGILLGVTRKAILKLAKEQGLTIEYRSPLLNESFNEAFLTSSSRGVVPIVSIDNKSVGQGSRRTEPVEVVGKWTKKLMSAYGEYVLENSELIL